MVLLDRLLSLSAAAFIGLCDLCHAFQSFFFYKEQIWNQGVKPKKLAAREYSTLVWLSPKHGKGCWKLNILFPKLLRITFGFLWLVVFHSSYSILENPGLSTRFANIEILSITASFTMSLIGSKNSLQSTYCPSHRIVLNVNEKAAIIQITIKLRFVSSTFAFHQEKKFFIVRTDYHQML